MTKQRELIARVLPAHRSAQERGLVELSTTAFYHPILPLLCDTDIARVSAPGLPLPQRFQHLKLFFRVRANMAADKAIRMFQRLNFSVRKRHGLQN